MADNPPATPPSPPDDDGKKKKSPKKDKTNKKKRGKKKDGGAPTAPAKSDFEGADPNLPTFTTDSDEPISRCD